jgi:hypothetical protein
MTALNPTAAACADVREYQRARPGREAIDAAIEAGVRARDWLSCGRTHDAFALIGQQVDLLRALRRSL